MTDDQRLTWDELRQRRMAEPGATQAYEAAKLAFELGAQVRELREERGWSQSEVARRAQMTQSAVARFEAGGTVPTLPVLYRLTNALGARLGVRIEGKIQKSEHITGKVGRASDPVTLAKKPVKARKGAAPKTTKVATGEAKRDRAIALASKASASVTAPAARHERQ